jgi:hypothetical protein
MAVDASFDTARLLRTMIVKARSVVKLAVTKAAALSVQIADWHRGQNMKKVASDQQQQQLQAHAVHQAKVASTLSLQNFLGCGGGSSAALLLGSFCTLPTLSSFYSGHMSQSRTSWPCLGGSIPTHRGIWPRQ